MDEDSQRWLNIALYDLETAEAMFESERDLYVVFCCQQAIEKILKALTIQITRKMPPRTHDLLYLSKITEIEMDDERQTLYRELSAYYMNSRYPEEVVDLASELTREEVEEILQKTKELESTEF